MLEKYFVRPGTVDRIRTSWIAEPIERWVTWRHEQGYARSTIRDQVPLLVHFGKFAADHGARTWQELPVCVEPFLAFWQQRLRERFRAPAPIGRHRCQIQKPIEEMIQLVVPELELRTQKRSASVPFVGEAPGFFSYLRTERGIGETAVRRYLHYLRRFEHYSRTQGHPSLQELSPTLLVGFIEHIAPTVSTSSVGSACDVLRVFLRYLHREEILDRDLSLAVERPRTPRLARVPRSISWPEVQRVLQQVDRRSAMGRRDFAFLLLLVTYGLRAHEVASLTLDDIDWRSGLLRISERKAGHSAHYRLTAAVGDALVDYIQHVRPQVHDRHVFFNLCAPLRPVQADVVASRASHWLARAGVSVPHAGSHTLRHAVVQHLLDHDFSLRAIGDYIGHRSPDSTQIYTKVDLGRLREIALGDGEEVLR